jgi:hypothetical protein
MKHMRTKHVFNQPQERPIPPPWRLDVIPDPLPEDFNAVVDVDHAHEQGDGEQQEWEYHPVLCGAYSLLSI